MSPSTPDDEAVHHAAPVRPGVRDWLWRPWYAKLWWAAISVWWTGMAASIKVALLTTFYASALAGYLNLLFFPMTAFIVLGFGYARAWLAAFAEQGSDANRAPFYSIVPDPFGDEFTRRRYGQPHPSVDIYDPRSGGLYIGNPFSPQHPGHH
ncbi:MULTISPECIES: hypothetical protein [Sphingomonadaceae]|uniref:hypothetical protein n=1 Tax=Sphingomonadales TaxID=204457 RepID=UPI00076FE94D|nr:hypothetical protein [Sphingobium sp. TKS]AMK23078.1 hypothetical protein K426_10680 [Sphingobium sp. TKS]MCF8707806.1 hypothetical protein [Rhizorhapis sp. SPR117]